MEYFVNDLPTITHIILSECPVWLQVKWGHAIDIQGGDRDSIALLCVSEVIFPVEMPAWLLADVVFFLFEINGNAVLEVQVNDRGLAFV